MSNRMFNVNGKEEDMLLSALQLVFKQASYNSRPCSGWSFHKEKGLILHWHYQREGINRFPASLDAKDCLPFVIAWLNSEEAKTVKLERWEEYIDHDGDNGTGWRVYCEDWGHVGGYSSAICAIKSVALWYGK